MTEHGSFSSTPHEGASPSLGNGESNELAVAQLYLTYRDGARRGPGLRFPLTHVVNDDTGGVMTCHLTPYSTTDCVIRYRKVSKDGYPVENRFRRDRPSHNVG